MNYDEANNYITNEITFNECGKLLNLVAKDDTIEGLKFIQEITSCDENTAKLLWVDLKCQNVTSETNPYIKEERQEGYLCQADLDYVEKMKNKPKCQICGSTNIKRITTTAKVVNVAMFGLLGNKRKYQWHCNNCNSDF